MSLTGTVWADTVWADIWGPIWGARQAAQAVTAAGRPRRKRWAVEWDGEFIEFSSAQAAVGWLRRQNKRAEKAAEKPASKIEEKPALIPFSAIKFDGEALSRVMVDGKRAVDRIKTMRDTEIRLVERRLAEMREEEEFLIDFLGKLD